MASCAGCYSRVVGDIVHLAAVLWVAHVLIKVKIKKNRKKKKPTHLSIYSFRAELENPTVWVLLGACVFFLFFWFWVGLRALGRRGVRNRGARSAGWVRKTEAGNIEATFLFSLFALLFLSRYFPSLLPLSFFSLLLSSSLFFSLFLPFLSSFFLLFSPSFLPFLLLSSSFLFSFYFILFY